VVERLLRRDHEVRALVRDPARAGWMRDRNVALVHGGLGDQQALRSLVQGADAVVHLVGIIVEVGSQTFQRVHVDGTKHVVAAAREAGVRRLVHMSALGARPDPEATAYHRSKAAAEEVVRQSGISHVIFRPSLIAGEGNEVLAMLVRMLRFSPIVPVIGDGRYQLQPVAAGDVAEAFAVALEREGVAGAFEIAGPVPLTYHQILDELEAALGVTRTRVSAPVPIVRFAAYAGMVLPNLNPITPEQLQMLLEGNTSEQNALPGVFGIAPRPFREIAREICAPYAATPSAAASGPGAAGARAP
jgi:NADH dehydrogenase